ncbi:MAG: zinc ribbon domain-containing protein [bacterium]|nr:zinc ribbon domain-containing protein [bacterium]
MPIYEYNCSKCGHFDAIQKVSDKPLKAKIDCEDSKCPKKAERLISASSFHLKGGGWYKTDYPASGSSGTKTTPAGSDSSKSESAGDSKPAAASDSSSDTKKKCGTKCGCH